jgi:uncharacterized protein (DUF1501 family)
MTTRRDFLKGILAGLALTAIDPWQAMAAPAPGEPLLVAVHLTGGNDALNTLVPHRSSLYRKARPNLALSSKGLLSTENDLALHPSLSRLHARWEKGQALLVPGVGREDHDRSHFRASDILHGAGNPGGDGWMAQLGKRLDTTPVSFGSTVSRAVACPDHPPVGLVGDKPPSFPGTDSVRRAWFGMYQDWGPGHQAALKLKRSAQVVEEVSAHLEGKMSKVRIRHAFGGDEFGKRFELAYRLIASGYPAKVMHLSAGQFDTHSGQLNPHAKQLGQFDRASDAFLKNMESLERRVNLLAYSEFGRRVTENFSGGTDHGAGGLAWMVGDQVEGGVIGEYGLDSLRDGDLPTVVHYKNLYARAVSSTFGKSHSEALFGKTRLG